MDTNDIKTEESNVKIIKKRGRKPKEKPEQIKIKNMDEYANNYMILHIPFYESINEINECNFETNNYFDKNSTYVMDFNNNDNRNSELQKYNDIIFNTNTVNSNNTNSQYIDLLDYMNNCKKNSQEELSNNSFNSYNRSSRNLYEVQSFFNDDCETISSCNEYQNENSKESNFPYCCYWDSEPFNTVPIGLPYKRIIYQCNKSNIKRNKYIVYGYFCSFGCMASYNFSLKDLQVNDRYLLINSMYKDIYGREDIIKFAPPKEMLMKYGGCYGINEFRKVSNSEIIRNYQLIIPPMLSMKCQIEEFYGNLNKKNSFVDNKVDNMYLDDERIHKAQERNASASLEKLKTKKNVVNKHNIENRMGIILKK